MPVSSGLRAALAVVAAAAAAAAALVLGATPASAATVSDCTQWGITDMQGGEYTYQQNEWNSSDTQCAGIDTGTGAWTITNANFGLSGGAPATYPSVYKGCHWGVCTANSGLPIQVSQLGSATSSWSTTQPASGAYDVAYDIWFNSAPTTVDQPDGTELMIWINNRGGVQPFGSQTGTANLAGRSWNVWTGNQSSWKIISYVLQGGATSVSDLDVKALIDDSVARGSLNPAHYLIDAEAGFEIWQGGQGLASNGFSFSASTGGNTGGDTTAPSVPANLTVTGTTSDSVSLSWSAATDNVGVTAYDVYRDGARVGSASSTSYTGTGLAAGTDYTYTVRSRDGAGNVSGDSAPVTATTTSGGGGSGCTASYHVDNDWGNGFTTTVTVTNTGTSSASGWHLGWPWGGDQRVTNAWNATVTQNGSSVTADSLGYNGTLAPGSSTTFGFQATYSGANPTPTLTCTY